MISSCIVYCIHTSIIDIFLHLRPYRADTGLSWGGGSETLNGYNSNSCIAQSLKIQFKKKGWHGAGAPAPICPPLQLFLVLIEKFQPYINLDKINPNLTHFIDIMIFLQRKFIFCKELALYGL